MKNFIRIVASFLLILPFVAGMQSNAHAAGGSGTAGIVEYAKKFQGTPYKWGGTTPAGFDCSGFLTYVFKQFGVELPRTSAAQYGQGEAVSKSELVPGDLVFYNTSGKGVSHASIYIGNGQVIHAVTGGVKITNMSQSYWNSRYVGAKRYIEPGQVKTATTLSVKKGQIGVVTIKKKINLWQRDENNKLKAVRVLNPGEQYRVYSKDNLYGGQFNLGSQLYITNMAGYINYLDVRN